jgi:hypothetical protein
VPSFALLLLIIGGLALVGVLAYFGWKAEQERREVLLSLATALGWSFDPSRDSDHDDEYAHFELFRRGHSRAAYNTLVGNLNLNDRVFSVKMGDFTYKITSSNGKTTTTRTYRFSYLIVHLPFRAVPDLLIRPEGLFDRIAGAFGFDDIDFESEEFSRRFHVKSPDKKFAYDVCHPRMMEFLLATNPPCVDIERGRCCISDGTSRWEPEQFKATLRWIEQFYGQWPEHVVKELPPK